MDRYIVLLQTWKLAKPKHCRDYNKLGIFYENGKVKIKIAYDYVDDVSDFDETIGKGHSIDGAIENALKKIKSRLILKKLKGSEKKIKKIERAILAIDSSEKKEGFCEI